MYGIGSLASLHYAAISVEIWVNHPLRSSSLANCMIEGFFVFHFLFCVEHGGIACIVVVRDYLYVTLRTKS
jgi:hypothetical protein